MPAKPVVVDLGPNLHSNNASSNEVMLNPNEDNDLKSTDTVRFSYQPPIIIDLGPTLSDPEAEEDIVTLYFDASPFKQTDTVRLLPGLTPERSTYMRLKGMLPNLVSRSKKVNPINADPIQYLNSNSELNIELKKSPERSSKTFPDILKELGNSITMSDAVKGAIAQENITTAENLNLLISFLKHNEIESRFKITPLLKEKHIMQLTKIVSSLKNESTLIDQLKTLLLNNVSSIYRLLDKLESLADQKKPITSSTMDMIMDHLTCRPKIVYPTASSGDGSKTPAEICSFRI